MRYLALLWLVLCAAPLFAAEPIDRVELNEDRRNLTSRLRVAAEGGSVALADLFRGVSRMNGYDDRELAAVLPRAGVSLNSRFIQWAIRKFNWLIAPCVACEVTRTASGEQALDVTVKRAAARQWVNRRKTQVRTAWRVMDCRRQVSGYGIELLGNADEADTRGIVVLVHGLNSRPEDLVALHARVSQEQLITATFRYPNDQPIDQSAALLSRELGKLKAAQPNCNVRLVTHSMGGLVARGVVENADLDPGNVTQLIMIAPPNHGSTLAGLATFMDCYEFFTSAARRRAGVLVESVSDGLGEAGADLEPNSVFLDQLNARRRNPHVRYTILLGTRGPMEAREMDALRERMRSYSDVNRYTRFAASKLNAELGQLDEVVDGKGDGVVSVARGRLEGVDDIVTLPFTHGGVLNGSLKWSQVAYEIVSARLHSDHAPGQR